MDILIKNARVIDPYNSIDKISDISVSQGKIVSVGKSDAECGSVIDASGLIACPGFVDMHVHLRDPGLTYKEDIESGSLAAAAGGVTSIAAMPNTKPVTDNEQTIKYIAQRSQNAKSNIYVIGAMTKEQKGEQLCDYDLYRKMGVVAVSDDGFSVENPYIMRLVLEEANRYGLLPICHCDDLRLIAGGIMNEGKVSIKLGLKGNPSAAEDIVVSRDILIAEYLGVPIHIAHVSTARSVELVREAKKRGVKVSCETAPHYFSLNDTWVEKIGPNARMNPPLRSEKDRIAIIEGIKDGTIDAIATDHAPHSADEKNRGLKDAPNGIIGLETSFAVGYTYLVKTGSITINRLIELMSINPAKLLKIKKGALTPGSDADITLIDPSGIFDVDIDKSYSKGKNTPYNGMRLNTKVKRTILGGVTVYEDSWR